jgi:hypothetical protein
MCLRFKFCIHQRVCVLIFLLESKIRCTLIGTLFWSRNNLFRKRPFVHSVSESGFGSAFDIRKIDIERSSTVCMLSTTNPTTF